MPKRNRSVANYVENETESESEFECDGSDFSGDDDDDYEPTPNEISQAENDEYDSFDSDSGETAEDLDLELREAAIVDNQLLYKSKDGKVVYSNEITTSIQNRSMNLTPGQRFYWVFSYICAVIMCRLHGSS